ncbi:hypothetical protein P153DRAFT_255487, partial [Dothidotthia symphoricarpi CBS 119687]
MSPDYSRTTEQVYTDLAELYLRKNNNLDVLGFVVHPAPDSAQMQGSAPVVNGSKLLVQCYRVDEISRLSLICEQVNAEMLRSWMVDTLGNNYPYTGETYEEAFSTSVVADIRYDPLGKCYSRGGRMI